VVASRVPRLADLPAITRTDAAAFTPPPRFGSVDLDGFSAHVPSQAAARERVRTFAAACCQPAPRRPWWRRFVRAVGAAPGDAGTPGLYLDGGFGVGKTHLLAAAYFAAPTDSKRYLSFQQLVHVIGVLGMAAAQRSLAEVRLLCLDEFELDDPGNTLIVKTFLAHLFERGGTAITTSNTPPAAQGWGRFAAEDFQREIQSIAERFEIVRVEGPDARDSGVTGELMTEDELPSARSDLIRTDWDGLLAHLRAHHPSRYRGQLERLGGLAVSGAAPLVDQNDALRLVHFIDTLYDLRVPLWLAARPTGLGADGGALELFDQSYRHGAYAAKYFRCASRLGEILTEARAAATGAAAAD
jgi:cell division protein ZapE